MGAIIRRELLDHLQSLHLVVLLCVSLVLFAADGMIFARRYVDQTARHTRHTSDRSALASTVRTTLYTEPGAFLFLSAAGDSRQPTSYSLAPASRPVPALFESGNARLPEIPETDWAFIIKIVFSLYVVLLGFDAVSGEKEQGTLRQALSHPIGRLQLLGAKFLAILLSALVPLLVGMLVSLVLLSWSVPALFAPEAVGRILVFLLLSILYLSVFALISLTTSSLIHDSSLVLLTVLVAWVLFAIIIPNTSGVVVDWLEKAPSEYSIAKQLGPATQQNMQSGFKAITDRVDRGELTTETQVQQEYNQLCTTLQADIKKVYETYDNALTQRSSLARTLSRVSPTALFQYASEGIAGTGTPREEKTIRNLREFSGIYDAYVLRKVGTLVGTTNWSFAATLEVGGKPVRIRSPYPVEYQGDKSDFPQFVQQKASVLEGIRDALQDSLGLIAWNIVLALGAAWAIVRSDVR
jgi:ABC-type transport system involved in multi-copper enzyme maturation permease subunit